MPGVIWLKGLRIGRFFPRRTRQGRGPLLTAAARGVALALAVICLIDGAMRPAVTALASLRVQNQVTAILNEAVAQSMARQGVDYADLVTLERDDAGRVTLLTVDSVKLNTLRTDILSQVLEQVEGLDAKTLGVPLGSLTGLAVAAGWGPSVPVRVVTAAVPRAEFSNRFTAQGINQTLHQLLLDVSVELTLLVPGGQETAQLSAQVCLAETLLVGEVPQTYLGQ